MYIIIDVVFCLLAVLFFYLGFRKGFLKEVGWLVNIAVIVLLFAILSPSVCKWLLTGTDLRSALVSAFEGIPQINAEWLAECIIKLGACIVLAIIEIVVIRILRHFIRKLVQLKAVKIIDKMLGGLFSLVVAIAILMVIGGILGVFIDSAPFSKLADLFTKTSLAKYIYGCNPLQDVFVKILPF